MLKMSLAANIHGFRRGSVAQFIENRAGAIVLWVLPVLAVLGLASYLLLAPGPRRVIAAGENSDGAERIDETDSPENMPGETDGARTSTGSTPLTVEQQLEGSWAGYYQGQRQLQVRPDGTATMIAEPEGLAAALLAAKLSFDIRWKINGDSMEFETLGGEPLDKVKVVLRMYGARRSHKILKLSANDLTLLDEDGVTKYEWHRVQQDSKTKPE